MVLAVPKLVPALGTAPYVPQFVAVVAVPALVALPLSVAVIVPALKLPLPSRNTI